MTTAPKFYAYVEQDFVQRRGQPLKAKTVLGAKREASELFFVGFLYGEICIAEIVPGGLNHLACRCVGGRFGYTRPWRACLAAEALMS